MSLFTIRTIGDIVLIDSFLSGSDPEAVYFVFEVNGVRYQFNPGLSGFELERDILSATGGLYEEIESADPDPTIRRPVEVRRSIDNLSPSDFKEYLLTKFDKWILEEEAI